MDFLSSVPREKRALRIDLAELRLSNFDRQFALPKWLYIGSIMLTVDLWKSCWNCVCQVLSSTSGQVIQKMSMKSLDS